MGRRYASGWLKMQHLHRFEEKFRKTEGANWRAVQYMAESAMGKMTDIAKNPAKVFVENRKCPLSETAGSMHVNRDYRVGWLAASMIFTNFSGTREAPPMRPPSMSG